MIPFKVIPMAAIILVVDYVPTQPMTRAMVVFRGVLSGAKLGNPGN